MMPKLKGALRDFPNHTQTRDQIVPSSSQTNRLTPLGISGQSPSQTLDELAKR